MCTFCLTYLILLASHLSFDIITLWPVDGLTLGLMIGRLRRRPYLTLVTSKVGVVAAGLWSGHPLWLSLEITTLYGVGTAIFFHLCQSFSSKNWYSSTKTLLRFISISAIVSFFVSIVQSMLINRTSDLPFFSSFTSHMTGDMVGYVVFTPLVAIFTQTGMLSSFDRVRFFRSTGRLATYGVAVLILFSLPGNMMVYTIPLGLMLIAYIEDLTAVAVALSLTMVIAVLATEVNAGPFQLIANREERAQALEVFLAVITVTMLPIAALMAEHDALKQSLIVTRADAEAANLAKSAFLANMSHEIRTPLNGILGMAQVLSMDDLSSAQHDKVSVLRKAGESLLSILNDILDISKIEAGKVTLDAIDFDLNEILRETRRNFDIIAQDKGLNLTIDMGNASGIYRGDPTRIRQILSNLVSNALKFTEIGDVGLAAAFGPDGLALSVSDTGMGVPDDKLDRLFLKFSQVDKSTTRRFGGAGLGLSICRELAEMMGGRMEVRTSEGRGSTFTLRLPLERVAVTQRIANTNPSNDAEPELSSLRILAAEDNPTNQLVLKTLLKIVDVDVVIVEDGAQAVEAWENETWDLVLMDIQMPVLDGLDAARAIRAREAELGRARTPIAAVTANSMAHQICSYFEAGMDAHLSKPIEAESLFALLTQMLEAPTTVDDPQHAEPLAAVR